ncbi:type I polyketide synthase, partial [Longimycelium tulufanense]|uniref:type I polyketide synthase n=1 Tax=Longimycelium tulufanense TaxID=907463 RepID=UPI001666E915
DFHGTGYTVDGACASSLLAVMTAARALCTGELDVALAGGVDLSLDPLELVGFARLGALAGTEMRVYDAHPTGFLPGEGCGVVVLARATDAHRLGLRVYAYLAGWGTSSDGSGGLTRPEVAGQAAALRRAYRMAAMDPSAITLVEGHGTGTAVGDQVELAALAEVRGTTAPRAALGSIKANIGHTKAAAGVAGLIKAALAVHHRVLPPTTGCQQPHELLLRPDTPLRVLDEPLPWDDHVPAAAVSAMGFGGINTHVVLTGAPAAARTTLPATACRWGQRPPAHDIVLVEADNAVELAAQLRAIAEQAGALSLAELHDLACTRHRTATGTAAVRAALVADRPEELERVAAAAARRLPDVGERLVLDDAGGFVLAHGAARPVGLLFPGQAASVRARLSAWAGRMDVPDPPPDLEVRDGDTNTAVAQAAIVRQSLAGLAWLQALGCEPVAAVGHSLGEITALVWSGALDPESGLRLAAERGRVMARHGDRDSTMANVDADANRVADLVAGTCAVVAGRNAADRTVVSGPTADVRRVLAKAAKAGIPATPLPVSHGFHSAAMHPARDPLRAVLARTRFGAPGQVVISTVTGRPLSASDDLRQLLVDQLTEQVLFTDALTELAHRCELLVEVGPGTILTALAARTAPDLPAVSLDCGGSTRRHALASAALAVAGGASLEPWFAGRAFRPLRLTDPLVFLTSPCQTRPATRSEPNPATTPVVAPEPVPEEVDSPVAALRAHLARTLELPLASIQADNTLLGDLHLNSLQVVQTVAAVANSLGKTSPATPLPLGDVTVQQAADVLAELPDAAPAEDCAQVPGVRDWVAIFAHGWKPYTKRANEKPANWRIDAPDGHWLHGLAPAREDNAPAGLVVALTGNDPVTAAELLRRIDEARPDRLLVVHEKHPAAVAIGRSVAAEQDSCAVTVVQLPPDAQFTLFDLAINEGYLELRITPDGTIEEAVTEHRPLRSGTEIPLGPGDVCLVTGGARGISAHSAAALAERTGCIPVILGRSAESDDHVMVGMRDLREKALAHYRQCDVTNIEDVREAITFARTLGEVRGLLHGAGVNEPQRMGTVTDVSLRRTLAPKVDGLSTLLGALGDQLRLVVAYGSVIGRCGLAGQAEYCVANEVMRLELERWAAEHPECRSHVLEWSVWSDIGMGVRLDVLDNLRRLGVRPITPTEGVTALLDILGDPEAPVTLLVSSRYPANRTLPLTGAAHPLLRFVEHTRVYTPGVEAVIDVELSTGTDPYLMDHRIDDVAVLPAVIGLEALAQADSVVAGERDAWAFADVDLRAPVTVPDRAPRTLRLAVLRTGAQDVDAVLRDDSDRFASDHFSARIGLAGRPPTRTEPRLPTPPPRTVDHPYYESIFFHSGRFRRVLNYETLTAFRVRARVEARQEPWFSDFHEPRLLLGDPGAHDAAIHALLVCVPHRRALPVSAERVTIWRKPNGILTVEAVEHSHTSDDYLFDVDVRGPDGEPVARWEGLRLRAVGAAPKTVPLPAELVGPLLSRRLIECSVADHVELVVTHSADESDDSQHLSGHVLRVLGEPTVGINWEGVDGSRAWPVLLGDHGWQLAQELADKADEAGAESASRVHTARTALGTLGFDPKLPLQIDQVAEDGVVVLRGRHTQVLTARLRLDLVPEPVTVSIAGRG